MRRTASDIFDEWLVVRAQAGEDAAMRKLVARWHTRLYRHARRLVDRAEAAEDATQEAWLAIVRSVRRLDDPARFGPWAYAIVTNKCRDWVRRQQRGRARGFDDANAGAVNDLRDERAVHDGSSDERDDAVRAVRAAMRELPSTQRAALALHYLDGMNIAEIATALGIPAGTVKSRLHHAREKLRAILERNERHQHHERVQQ